MARASRPSSNRSTAISPKRKLARAAGSVFGMESLDRRTLFAGGVANVEVLFDLNGNGIKNAEEPGLESWDVFADYNSNGVRDGGEPQTKTDIDGAAELTGLNPGTYRIAQVPPAGWVRTNGVPNPSQNYDVRTIVNNDNVDVLFLNSPTGTSGGIDGFVWADQNGDGIQDPEDTGISGWTVYIDVNNDRALNAGDITTITDGDGNFSFTGLSTGRYRVTVVQPTDWDTTLGSDSSVQVDVVAGSTESINFGNFTTADRGAIIGTVWNDINADGARAAGDLGLGDWTVYLDLNNNNSLDASEPSTITDFAGSYAFPNLLPGTYKVTEIVKPGYNTSPGRPSSVSVTMVGDANLVVDFANFTPANGSVTGTVWNDLNGNGVLNAGEPGLAGWTVYIDENGDGLVTSGEPSAVTGASGSYTLSDVAVGTNVVREIPAVGWSPTAPATAMQTVTVLNASNTTNINFGNKQRTDGAIVGAAFVDSNHNGVRNAGERGLSGVTVYIDSNNNAILDAGEQSAVTSVDFFYTPAVDEAGTYSFTHLPGGDYVVREIVPVPQNATPSAARVNNVTLAVGEERTGVNFANVFRDNEIHGVKYDDLDHDGIRDSGEPGVGGVTVFLDLDRDDVLDLGEPKTITAPDGSYTFVALTPGAYVVREVLKSGHHRSEPATLGGVLWPAGVSNPAVGNVTPGSITTSLAQGQTYSTTVSITLPGTGALTNMVDVFLLFDDTGSFTGNSPIVRAAFPEIITALQAGLPGLDLGFGVGRMEEYGNFAAEYGTGRPFILNQPIVSQSTAGYATAIQAALDRTAPGYGGDTPETDIEALFQTVTGRGFDGNNNGTTSDSGAAGLANTQVNPGLSGDVPAFSSFTPDPTNNVMPASGTIGGAGFRAGALPIVLLATDTGFAYQPKGETSISGLNGLTLPISALTQASRNTTPFNSGAGIQETVTALNALGALVVGLGTNPQANIDPRQQLEALAKLTGATNNSATTIANGTTDAIAPGDPFYFQIASGFGASVANGIVSAIQNAVTNTSVNITVRASDPRVQLTVSPGVINDVGAGQTASFNITFTGDGIPHRFDLQFIKQGTDVVLGSIPVVLGTPIVGDGYCFDDLEEGEIEEESDFGSYSVVASGGVISGQIYEDRNCNNVFDGEEPSLLGVTVYLDLNDNGTMDGDEPSTTTSGAGDYVFTGLADGAYVVRQVLPAGHSGSNSHPVTLAGSSQTGQNFANVPTTFNVAAGTSSVNVRANGDRTDIVLDGVTAYSILRTAVPGMTFNLAGSDAAVVIDFAAADPTPTGGIQFLGGDANDQIEFHGAGLSDQFTITPAGLVTHGTSQIALGGAGRIGMVNGTYNAAGALVLTGVTVDAAKLAFASGAGTSDFGSLELLNNATLDLSDNAMILRGAAANYASIRDSIGSGFNFGSWNGTGITSSSAQAQGNTGLGVATGLGTFDGLTIAASDLLVKYTLQGDANLDGTVDDADLFLFLSQYTGSQTGDWLAGDYTYDGVVDDADLFVFLPNYTQA